MTTNIAPQNKSFLPPRQVIGPDENGIKKTIEYKFNEKGEMVRVTTTSKVRKFLLRSRKDERKLLPKFGDAAEDADANKRLTMVSTEQIFLERTNVKHSIIKGIGQDEMKNEGDFLAILVQNRGPQQDDTIYRFPSSYGSAAVSGGSKSTYTPPSQRSGSQRRSDSDMRRRNIENSVRVSCLSEDADEDDLYDLFRPFGALTRVSVATDWYSGLRRGFGYVSFVNKDDAAKAIETLDGYGYGSLILHVEWSHQNRW